MSDLTRETSVYSAKLAEQAERFDEMAEIMKCLVEAHSDLTVEERNLLSVAYKNAVGSRRASWRILSSVEKKQRGKDSKENADIALEYCNKVEEELNTLSMGILNILEFNLLPATTCPETRVFYHKMQGDYYRYLAEFKQDQERMDVANKALKAYEESMEVAKNFLTATHPVRLGLALNYSVFHYEILREPETACDMAQKAFDDAMGELDSVTEDTYRDSTLIMQLLRDNVTLWTTENVQPENEESIEPEKY